MKINIFIKNTAVLMVTSLIIKTVGVFFRVWLADEIGAEGIGLYQMIFSVYMLAAAFATSGVSTAVTRLIAEHETDGKETVKCIMRKAVYITLAAATVTVLLIFIFSKEAAIYLLKDERAEPSLKILSLSLPFMGLSSCFRGYFLARRKTLQPSVVQLFEQCVRIAVTVICIHFTAGKSLEYTAAAVLLGDTVAEAASFTVNYILYIGDKAKIAGDNFTETKMKSILNIALPVTGSSYLSSLLHTAENLLVPLKLAEFYGNRAIGLSLFGTVRGMALPLLLFPASFLSSLSTMLLPEVSSSNATGDSRTVNSIAENTVDITLKLSTFVATVFVFNAEGIGRLVYGSSDVGATLRILAPIIPFMYLESVTAGLLKGLDCQSAQLGYNTFDSAVRIIAVTLILPTAGIKGYLGIMITSNIFTCMMSIRCIKKKASIYINLLRSLLYPLSVSVGGGILGKTVETAIKQTNVGTVISIMLQCAVAAFLLILPMKRRDRLKIPKRNGGAMFKGKTEKC